MGDGGTDGDAASFNLDALEGIDMPEVDEVRRLGEALFQRRDQGLPAGDELAVFGTGEEFAGILDGRGAVVAGE